MDRVLFATEARSADFAQMLRDGKWPDADLRTTVLLEGAPAASTPRRPGRARIVSYRNTEVVLEADSPDGGWVVLNDLWHPWWFAHVDGQPAELLRANVLFRAVAVPPGRHTVRFVFRPLAGAWRQITGRRAASAATLAVHARLQPRRGNGRTGAPECAPLLPTPTTALGPPMSADHFQAPDAPGFKLDPRVVGRLRPVRRRLLARTPARAAPGR